MLHFNKAMELHSFAFDFRLIGNAGRHRIEKNSKIIRSLNKCLWFKEC